jgi:tetratricopeptide (TPR) repeat protein
MIPIQCRRATLAVVALILSVSVLSAAPAWAQGTQAPDQPSAAHEIDRLLGDIVSESNSSVALAKSVALARFHNYVPADVFVEQLESAAQKVTSPLVHFRLMRIAAFARLNSRDFTHGKNGMDGPIGKMGCITDWSIVGPFDNPSMEGFHAQLAPERGESGPYDGKLTGVDWRDNPPFHRLCNFDLSRTIQPETAAVTYLAVEIDAKRAGDARLLIGSEGAYKIWFNGEPIGLRPSDVSLGIDGQAWALELDKGRNHLLIKLGSAGDGDLGLIARLTDPQLRPISDVTFRPVWSAEPVEAFDEDPQPTGQGAVAIAREDAEKPGGKHTWSAWLMRELEPDDASTPWRQKAEEVFELSKSKPESVDPRELALAAELLEEHWRRVDLLTLANERRPDDPWIALNLAREYSESIATKRQWRERGLLEHVLETYPTFLPGVIAMSDWYSQRGFTQKALEVMRDYEGPRRDETVAYLRQIAYLEDSAGRSSLADQHKERLRELAAITTNYDWGHARELLAAGEVDDALEIVTAQLELMPWSTSWGRFKAEILRSMGDHASALAQIDSMIEAMPGRSQLYRDKAGLLEAMGRTAQAVEAIEVAMDLRPQDQSLREYHAHLQPNTNRFYEPWMLDEQRIRQLADNTEAESFNYDTLVDQKIVHVAANGLAQEVVQRVDRVITAEGVDGAKRHRVVYQTGDERVDILKVRVYKADGTVSEDFDRWYSGGSRKGSTIYNDSASAYIRANNVQPGDLIEFRYRKSQVANENFRGDYFGDISYLQSTLPNAFVRYAVHYPATWELYFREPTLEHERLENALPGEAELDEGYRVAGFELTDVEPVKTDPDQPGYTDVYDYVIVSNKETWDEIGTWWWNLVKEQLIVDDTIGQKVAELTEGLETEDQKIRAIHNYVVKNTRYLHVGLGIHGWKPYRTTTCFRNRYGDCKDKAALLKVMLEEAGIPAKLVLVRTRRLGRVDSFPASMHVFNHAITYVPSKDLFLDGTAEFNGTRELTPMDQGAQALIVDDGGEAEFMTLPVDDPRDNLMRRELSVDLTGDKPVASGHIVATGQNAVYYRKTLEDPERRDEVFEKQLADLYPGATLRSATYKHLSNLEKPVEITFTFEGGRLERSNDGGGYVYPYGSPKDLLTAYAKQAYRNQDLTVRVPFENHTTMTYQLDDDRAFDEVPDDVDIETKFGAVDIDYRRSGNTLEIDIRYSIDVQRVSVEDYPKFREFTSEMTAALNETVELTEE